MSTYRWCAVLGSVGLLETSYLTFIKLFNVEAFCPVGGGGCSDVLNSDYAVVYGVPLPLFGMVAYGLVAWLGLQLSRDDIPSVIGKTDLRFILFGTTTTMAAASACFLYILSSKLAGASCSYCLSSALLSFSLFLLTLKDFSFQELQKMLGLQLVIAGIVVVALSNSYNMAQPQVSSDFELEPFKTEVTTTSTPFAISLAKYLHSIGAKMYGAFWCSHCQEQKQMFGREAMQILDYVECFPNGAGKGREMIKECSDIGLEGFPTWIVKGQVLNGEKDLEALAEASGFTAQFSLPELVIETSE